MLEPGAQNLFAGGGDVHRLRSVVGKRSQLIVSIERGDTDQVGEVIACRIVRSAIIVGTRIACSRNEQNSFVIGSANYIFQRARLCSRAPARRNYAHIDAGAFAIDYIVDCFNRVFGRT